MSFDLSWLWETLNSIVSTMQSWFTSIWSQAQNIVNTGQGIFSGLVAFGSQIWDAITKAFSTLGEWFYNALSWIWQGLVGLGQALGQWISSAFQWLASGVQWVASGIYAFGQWLYNSLLYVWNWIVNTLKGVWDAIVNWFSGVASSIGEWWNAVIQGINTWFTNLLKVFRQKIVTTIMVDVGITGMWKSAERILHPSTVKDIGYGLLGLALSPVIGYTMGKFIDAIVPLPSTETYPLIPSISGFAYTPPSMTVETPSPPTPPSAPPTPPLYGYVPVYDLNMSSPKTTYTATPMAGTTKSLSQPSEISYETDSGEGYGQDLNIEASELSYETEVT
ncbi:MAG: hypothetical protein KIH10_16365 [Candidatus Freyarchaeota archaeon]|nr:hypothetical protein [Candidatus Jordarchaeia archaeon]MBS7281140.1 hypothetical protein [Candidatus Jordarchaeia archaeon]